MKKFYTAADRQKFYNSIEWKEIKEGLFEIRGDTCERCKKKKGIQVHHLTYERFGGDELPEDLLIVCRGCHMKEHGLLKSGDDYLITKKIYIEICNDLITGILLSQLAYWFNYENPENSRIRVFKDNKGWVAKRRTDWKKECCISEYQYDRSIKLLKKMGLVETKIYKFMGEPTTHISLLKDNFLKTIEKYYASVEEED